MSTLDPALCRDVVRRALDEDVGAGDVTTTAVVPEALAARASILARTPCVVAGLALARETFRQVDPGVAFTPACRDGDRVEADAVLVRLAGSARALLTAERTALNFLQHLSGIATLTRRYVEAAGGRIQVLDTRKTIPTLRVLAKYAVQCGGGVNHRQRLDAGVLVKDNHIRIAGGIAAAVTRARAGARGLAIEVECESLDQVDEALEAGADVIMLDNLSSAAMREAVHRIGGRARVEISGRVTLDRMADLASIGADMVSVGALTHSAPAVDISLEFDGA